MEQHPFGRVDVRTHIAAEQHRKVVLLEHGLMRVTRKANCVCERVDHVPFRARGAAVDRQMHRCLARHVLPEVRQAPADGHTQTRRRRGVTPIELGEDLLEFALRGYQVVGCNARRDDAVMKRRRNHGDAVVPNDCETVEQVLLRM